MRYIKILVLTLLLLPVSVYADQDMEHKTYRTEYKPSAEAMVFDGLVLRPLYLAGTVIGSGVFLVTLPFSLIGGNVDDAGRELVGKPARATFSNCLGCINQYHHERRR